MLQAVCDSVESSSNVDRVASDLVLFDQFGTSLSDLGTENMVFRDDVPVPSKGSERLLVSDPSVPRQEDLKPTFPNKVYINVETISTSGRIACSSFVGQRIAFNRPPPSLKDF